MKNSHPNNTIAHDIRGQICPSCLLFTLREVHENRELLKNHAGRIIIMTDNRDATATIPQAVANMGYDFIVEKKDDYYTIEIIAKK
jgi:TusA-related sulfurtransferase